MPIIRITGNDGNDVYINTSLILNFCGTNRVYVAYSGGEDEVIPLSIDEFIEQLSDESRVVKVAG